MTDETLSRSTGDGQSLDEMCRAVIDEANARGGPDNATAVVVETVGSEPQ
jgi:serine/threonine protein phosphatase PrpC